MPVSSMKIYSYVYAPGLDLTKEVIYQAFEGNEGRLVEFGFTDRETGDKVIYNSSREKIRRDELNIDKLSEKIGKDIWSIDVLCETRDSEEILDVFMETIEKLSASGFTFYRLEELYSPPFDYITDDVQTVIFKEGDSEAKENIYPLLEKRLKRDSQIEELNRIIYLFEDYELHGADYPFSKEKIELINKGIDLYGKDKLDESELEKIFKIFSAGSWGFSYELSDYLNEFKEFADFVEEKSIKG